MTGGRLPTPLPTRPQAAAPTRPLAAATAPLAAAPTHPLAAATARLVAAPTRPLPGVSRRLLRSIPALSLLIATALLPTPAAAQPPPPKPAAGAPASPPPPTPAAAKKAAAADRDAARALAEQAFEKLQARKYEEAIDLFHKAEELFHAPTHLIYIAQAREKKSQLLDAADTYRKILAETLPRDAPQPFRDAQAEARRALDSLVARTPKLRVEVAGADPATVQIQAAGRVVLPGATTSFDPGTHLVRVTPTGAPPLERSVVLAPDGREIVVRFDLARPMSLAFPILSLGLGAAAGGATFAMGVASHDMQTAAIEACKDLPTCPREQQDKGASGRTLRDAAIVTGIIGGALLVTGVTLFLVRPTPESTVDPPDAAAPSITALLSPLSHHSSYSTFRPRPTTVARPAPPSPTLALRAGPSFISLVGSF